DGNVLRATATDGYRVAVASREGTSLGRSMSVVVPGRVLNEVERVLPADGDVTVVLGESTVVFEVGPFRVIGRLLDGTYPDVLSLLPQEYPFKLTVDRQALFDALSRADLLAGGQDTKHRIELQCGQNKVVVVAQDPELGAAREELEGEYYGEPLRIGFNARYLMDGLKVIDTDTVRIGFVSPDKAALVEGGGNGDYQYIVLPVLLPAEAETAAKEV
ncbi:MAG TPA: DNA polymerase III subunit beta, partial [Calditerricola sp.]